MIADAAFAPTPHVMSREVSGETVLLHLETGTYFALNAVGALVWDLLENEPRDIAQLTQEVAAAFDAEPGTIHSDIAALLDALLEHDLVTRTC